MSGDSSDSGELSLSCSVSSVEIEESEVSAVDGYPETIEPYQFEPVATNPSSEADAEEEDGNFGDEERIHSRHWYGFACMVIEGNPRVLTIHHDVRVLF